MPRWKQVFRCPKCDRRKWRTVETEAFAPKPDAVRLSRAALCGACGACGERGADVWIYAMLPRWMDSSRAGGCAGNVDFKWSEQRDRDIAAGVADGRTPPPEELVQFVSAEHAKRA